jgi:hypothetical protein
MIYASCRCLLMKGVSVHLSLQAFQRFFRLFKVVSFSMQHICINTDGFFVEHHLNDTTLSTNWQVLDTFSHRKPDESPQP